MTTNPRVALAMYTEINSHETYLIMSNGEILRVRPRLLLSAALIWFGVDLEGRPHKLVKVGHTVDRSSPMVYPQVG